MKRGNRWAVALAALLLGSTTISTAGVAAGQFDTSGLELVGPDAIQAHPQNESEAIAFDAALGLALKDPKNYGYPWIDADTGSLEISVVNEAGRASALAAESSLPVSNLTVKITEARASVAQLDKIADDVTYLLADGVTAADLIWKTEPDQNDNRVIITVRKLDPQLMKVLAVRFGTSLIAVRVRDGGSAGAVNRDSDSPPFWGGAYMTTSTGKACSTGLAWTASGKSAMLTAAHCISTGGTVSYPNYSNVGSVASGSEENWSNTGGTQYYTGQSTYRGDVALIRYYSYSSSPYVYSGAPHTSNAKAVAGDEPTPCELR